MNTEPAKAEPKLTKVSPQRRRLPYFKLLFSAVLIAAGTYAWKMGVLFAPKDPAPNAVPEPSKAAGPWDGRITLTASQQAAMGIVLTPVVDQQEPIQLPLVGTTKYDEEQLSRVRIMFQGRVDRVHVRTGQEVRRGDPLVDIYSTALADAKSEFEIREIEWEYQSRLAKTREDLRKQGSISEQLYLETRNDEMRKRREMDVAKDRLLIYGLAENEIKNIDEENGTQKAKMTLRAPADGTVVERHVVAGNLYDADDTLMIITPIDHLWIWGNIFESDIDLVSIGQTWEIKFPFLKESLRGKVEYISHHVDPATRAVRIRTSIPNPGGRLRADMMVSGTLGIPKVTGRTVVPRSALVVAGDRSYVFVRSAGEPDRFARRSVTIAHETASEVIIESGLKAGDEAVSTGALMLAQLFEDNRVCSTGLPGTPTGSEEAETNDIRFVRR